MRRPHSRSWVCDAHWLFLRCYPPEFLVRFRDEAQRVFEERFARAAERGVWHMVVFALLALADVPLSGLSERVARRAAHREPEERLPIMDRAALDLRMGFRLLRRSGGVTLLSIAALALGIGVTTATFSVVNAVLLAPLPYAETTELVSVRGGQSYLDLEDWMSETSAFRAFGGFRPQSFDIATAGGPERVQGVLVTGRLFEVLRVRPLIGRLIEPGDDQPGADRVAVLSHGFWQRAFGGRREVVGELLAVVDQRYRIVGVLPADFFLPLTAADVIAAARPLSNEFDFRGVHSLSCVGRLHDGVRLPTAQAELDALAGRLAERYPQSNKDRRFTLQSLEEWRLGGMRVPLLILFAAVSAFWLLAGANLANLQLARAFARRAEMALRQAIGASMSRLTSQLVVEHLCLAVPAGLFGVGLAWWLVRVVSAFGLEAVPRLDQTAIDTSALLFAAGVTALSGVAFGALPALTSIAAPDRRGIGRGNRGHGSRNGIVTALLAAEVAVTLVLTIGGALLLQSYSRLMSVDPGFDTSRLLTFNITLRPLPRLPRAPTPTSAAARTAHQLAERNRFFEDVIAAVRRIPGVTAVAATTDLPIAEGSSHHNVIIEGRPVVAGDEPEVYYRGVSPGFFRALGLPILRGREVDPHDAAGSQPVAVVNEVFAVSYFAGAEALGRRIRWSEDDPWITIVGVSADVKAMGLDADEVPAVYGPFVQDQALWRRSMDFALRTTVEPASVVPAVRRAVASVDLTIPVIRVHTMDELIARSTLERRFMLTFLLVFSIVSLVLVIVGVYGAVSYAVRMRTQEFGVRLALGARPGQIVELALRQAWWCTAAGTAVGLAGAVVAVRVIASLLFEVSEKDLGIYMLAVLGVGATATLAALAPAARAARIDPLIVLRRE